MKVYKIKYVIKFHICVFILISCHLGWTQSRKWQQWFLFNNLTALVFKSSTISTSTLHSSIEIFLGGAGSSHSNFLTNLLSWKVSIGVAFVIKTPSPLLKQSKIFLDFSHAQLSKNSTISGLITNFRQKFSNHLSPCFPDSLFQCGPKSSPTYIVLKLIGQTPWVTWKNMVSLWSKLNGQITLTDTCKNF